MQIEEGEEARIDAQRGCGLFPDQTRAPVDEGHEAEGDQGAEQAQHDDERQEPDVALRVGPVDQSWSRPPDEVRNPPRPAHSRTLSRAVQPRYVIQRKLDATRPLVRHRLLAQQPDAVAPPPTPPTGPGGFGPRPTPPTGPGGLVHDPRRRRARGDSARGQRRRPVRGDFHGQRRRQVREDSVLFS